MTIRCIDENLPDQSLWGSYLSERQWGTVREDYSEDNSSWYHFSQEHAPSRAYRWGEDGLLGWTDRGCRLCFSFSFWNGKDPLLKERLFGVHGPEGNHGEDVKECYFYLDATPSHSYMKALYQYPIDEFPYQRLREESQSRTREHPEFELDDTGIFDENRYFDATIEYARASATDTLIRLTLENRGDEDADLHVLPTIWFRNTWAWGRTGSDYDPRPEIRRVDDRKIEADHPSLGSYIFLREDGDSGFQGFVFTENESNFEKLYQVQNRTPFTKDAFHEYLIHSKKDAVNPAENGTKAASVHRLAIPAKGKKVLRFRLLSRQESMVDSLFGEGFDSIMSEKIEEADRFYLRKIPEELSPEEKRVMRQAYAGLIWTQQFYYYSVKEWLEGDPSQPTPPEGHRQGRNSEWEHFYCKDIVSVPDKWEYPWLAEWDLAFHTIPFSRIDAEFAKSQLMLLLRERFMSPRGEIPAYEYNFSDANPPAQAWACWRVYLLSAPEGSRDREFLSLAFHKLLINFTWWINRKEVGTSRLFSGGFLGLDNISVFDRSQPPPTGGSLGQADATAWMALYSLTMLSMALELSKESAIYEEMALNFLDHFVSICDAMNSLGGAGLWNEEDGIYYDQLLAEGSSTPVKVRSLVGLMPMMAVQVIDDETLARLPTLSARIDKILESRKDLTGKISYMDRLREKANGKRLLAVPSRERLTRMMRYLLDEGEFLSPFGIRSVSKFHERNPCVYSVHGVDYRLEYAPGESRDFLYGGNSNWRGPVWFPINYLLIESLERYHAFYGDSFRVECPTGSGRMMNLQEVAEEITQRLTRIFLPDSEGVRPFQGKDSRFKDRILFHEYFHGETGQGLGASHQTGWTALVTRCLEKIAKSRAKSARLGNRTDYSTGKAAGIPTN